MKRYIYLFLSIFLSICSSFALAQWQDDQVIGGITVDVYVPNTTPKLNNKRALMVTMHSCGGQSAQTSMRESANWPPTADEYGMVVAVPLVPADGEYGAGCWNVLGNNQTKESHANKKLLAMIDELINSKELNIDPKQVYLTGLSAGAGQSIVTGCVAPDVIAGFGVVNGPTLGIQKPDDKSPTKESVTRLCEKFAGTDKAHFNTQIASILRGTRDSFPEKFTEASAYAMSQMYGAEYPSVNVETIPDRGTKIASVLNGKDVVSIIEVEGLGHLWPAGQGTSGGGNMDHSTINYPAYITKWFFENNRRVNAPDSYDYTVQASEYSIEISGYIESNIVSIETTLENLDADIMYASKSAIVDANDSFEIIYNNLRDGEHQLIVNVCNNKSGDCYEDLRLLNIGDTPDTAPDISLMGDNPLIIIQGNEYIEPGYSAIDKEDGDITYNVTVFNNIDINTPDTYSVVYNVIDSAGNHAPEVTRQVIVKESQCAEFTDKLINHEADGRVYSKTTGGWWWIPKTTTWYLTSTDENLGTDGQKVITISLSDGQEYKLGSCPGPDTQAPVITLIGDNPLEIKLGSIYSEPGATATDNNDGDITNKIVIKSDVDTSTIGTYTVTYDVTDAAGNAAATVNRQVKVVEGNIETCFTSTNTEHVSAGRAYKLYNILIYSTGGKDYLGLSTATTSLKETSTGVWDKVTSCN